MDSLILYESCHERTIEDGNGRWDILRMTHQSAVDYARKYSPYHSLRAVELCPGSHDFTDPAYKEERLGAYADVPTIDPIPVHEEHELDVPDMLSDESDVYHYRHYPNLGAIDWTNRMLTSIIRSDEPPSFIDPRDNEKYPVFHVDIIRDDLVYIFWCRHEDPFFLIQEDLYGELGGIGFQSSRSFLHINHSDVLRPDSILFTMPGHPRPQRSYSRDLLWLPFGIGLNVGHHIWNQVSGLYYLLHDPVLMDRLPPIVVNHDMFGVIPIIREQFPHVSIMSQAEISPDIAWFPCRLNHYYIPREIITWFVGNDEPLHVPRIITLTFSIRSRFVERRILNMASMVIRVMTDLMEHYHCFDFLVNITGDFIVECHGDCYKLERDDSQHDIFNDIQAHFEKDYPRIRFRSFINCPLRSTLIALKNTDLGIGGTGTHVANLLNWIYRIPYLTIGTNATKMWGLIQYGALRNYDGTWAPGHVIDEHGNNNVEVHLDEISDVIKERLNTILVNKRT